MTDQQHETYSRDEIRRALGSAMDPLTGREVCDVLGCASRKERDGVYKALSLMAGHKVGIEQLDDGRYTLIPGWTESRPAAASARMTERLAGQRQERTRQDPMLGRATTDRQVNAERAPEPAPKPDGAEPGAEQHPLEVVVVDSLSALPPPPAPRPAAPPRQAHTPPRHQERLQARRSDEVGIPRATLRVLVAALLEHAGELTERQRQATVDATRLAA